MLSGVEGPVGGLGGLARSEVGEAGGGSPACLPLNICAWQALRPLNRETTLTVFQRIGSNEYFIS